MHFSLFALRSSYFAFLAFRSSSFEILSFKIERQTRIAVAAGARSGYMIRLPVQPDARHERNEMKGARKTMPLPTLLREILHQDHGTRNLDDAEARMLIEWLVDQTEQHCARDDNENRVGDAVRRRCRQARGIARFVALWCHDRAYASALQLAATERFAWPLPSEPMDACDLMSEILAWEARAEERAIITSRDRQGARGEGAPGAP